MNPKTTCFPFLPFCADPRMNIDDMDRRQNDATAAKLQAMQRGRAARKEVAEQKETASKKETASRSSALEQHSAAALSLGDNAKMATSSSVLSASIRSASDQRFHHVCGSPKDDCVAKSRDAHATSCTQHGICEQLWSPSEPD